VAKMVWGMLGAGRSISERRTRTLEVGGVIKEFNNRAVPDLGNLWYAKQLFLALLGVHIAERAREEVKFRVTNIEVANAIEALGCIIAFGYCTWTQHERLLGSTKMRGKHDHSFRSMRHRDFYVTQPMRMGMLQPLLAFGLVKAKTTRFNDYYCTPEGVALLNIECEGTQLITKLLNWVTKGATAPEHNESYRNILSQLEPLSKKTLLQIKASIELGNASVASPDGSAIHKPQRRSNALRWVQVLQSDPNQEIDWKRKPVEIEQDHWSDLQAGALFTNARDAAMKVLDDLEVSVAQRTDHRFPVSELKATFEKHLAPLRDAARKFLDLDYSLINEATRFCAECNDSDSVQLIINLVKRDERVLRFSQSQIVPGAAFRSYASVASYTSEIEVAEPPKGLKLPLGTSYRIRNLYWLNVDLNLADAQTLNSLAKAGVEG